jgi:hypothetical protein
MEAAGTVVNTFIPTELCTVTPPVAVKKFNDRPLTDMGSRNALVGWIPSVHVAIETAQYGHVAGSVNLEDVLNAWSDTANPGRYLQMALHLYSGTATARASGYLADDSADTPITANDLFNGATLLSNAVEYIIADTVLSSHQVTVTGTPGADAYTIRDWGRVWLDGDYAPTYDTVTTNCKWEFDFVGEDIRHGVQPPDGPMWFKVL